MSVKELQEMMEKQNLEFQAMRESYQADLAHAQQQLAAQGQQAPAVADFQEISPEVGSVAIRLPSFWTTAPELWFAQVEASFDNQNPKITSDLSKYNHILQALNQDVLMECQQAVNSRGQDRYENLKAALLKAYGKSAATKGSELLELCANPGCLGDKRPSSIMSEIRTLSDNSYDSMERAMFLLQLATPVRTALASSKARTNDELVTEADAIQEEFRIASRVRSAPHTATVEVDAAFRQRQYRPSPPVLPVNTAASQHQPSLCYLHRKHGARANACRSVNCPMKHILATPPAPGNARAGR